MASTRGKTSSGLGLVPSGTSRLAAAKPFLRIPPFPGSKRGSFRALHSPPAGAINIADELRRLRVGGSFWGPRPDVPARSILVRTPAALNKAREIAGDNPVVIWAAAAAGDDPDLQRIGADCDPWHVLASASAMVTSVDDEIRVIAALLRVPVYLADGSDLLEDPAVIPELLARHLPAAFENPFTGEALSLGEAIELCGFWRELIDSNRGIGGGLGFAFWKQQHVAPLLWNGAQDFKFAKTAGDLTRGASVAVWRSKASSDALADLERAGNSLIEVEDGFLRSRGLGADCIPPLSITVDALGAYFDPSRPSELESLLQDGSFDAELLGRAAELRRMIVEAGIGKYEQGGELLDRPAGDRVHILVPGQVEDDRAVQSGGCGLTSNLELLKRVRAQAPDAYILYKPHPDVVAGHRRGDVAKVAALEFANEVVGDHSINSLIEMVDEVHVNTSLAGFEALLREKRVTTYGVPFYAGWGLTTDLGPVPQRRSRKRSLDELVAAALLVYPRYLDPVTGLPCPAEVVVARLAAGDGSDPGLLVGVRRLQGKVMRRLRSLVQ